ncbi:MAG: B12-binding domain-containing radical SAM protein [Candidatus Latescibacteria bacterium]|nr:B12-binding domain-containing radical SAM protein [Candidatus Latescibacterota bacterium]
MKKKVLLINPSVSKIKHLTPKDLPLALLYVASRLVDTYDIVILDREIKKENERLTKELLDPRLFCVGITVLTGIGIHDAIFCSKKVRELRDDVTIVWGGWHATNAQESILIKSYVDYIIQGEGENVFPELLNCLEKNESPNSIPGLGYKINGKNYLNPPQFIQNLDDIPRLPYHLIHDIEPYIFNNWIPEGNRCLPLITSHGCPMGCSFCEVTHYFGKHYGFQSASRIIDEVKYLKDMYDIGGIRIYDPNFFLRFSRVKEFAQMMIDENLNIKWAGDGTVIQFEKIGEDDLNFLYSSGLRYISLGIESGSEKVRYDILNKKFTNAQCEKVIGKLNKANIEFRFNIILGIPGETEEDIMESVNFSIDIISRYPNTSFHVYTYLPLPGAPLVENAQKMGYKLPKKLEDYTAINSFNIENLPWLTNKRKRMINTISTMSIFLSTTSNSIPFKGIKKYIFSLIRSVFLYRMKKHIFLRTPDIIVIQKTRIL